MRIGGILWDLAQVTIYSVMALLFLAMGSYEMTPVWIPLLMGVWLFGCVSYCAMGRHRQRWKATLWIVPGTIALVLLIAWGLALAFRNSGLSLGARVTLRASPTRLVIFEKPPPGVEPFISQTPWISDCLFEYWPSHVHAQRDYVTVPPNTPMAFPARVQNYSPPIWVTPQYTAQISLPIWWPIVVLGFPTSFWCAVILAGRARRGTR